MAALVDAGADALAIADTRRSARRRRLRADVREGVALRHRRHSGAVVVVDDGHGHGDHDDEHDHHEHGDHRTLPFDPRSDRQPPTFPSACAIAPNEPSTCSPRWKARCIGCRPTTSSSTKSDPSTPSSTSSARAPPWSRSASSAIVCSSITVGEGTVLAAHGHLPNPAPAVTELLARRNAPSRGIDDRKELATPTGVALMCALADEFGPMPAINVDVGRLRRRQRRHRRPSQRRAGRDRRSGGAERRCPSPASRVQLLETNVDDATGEVIAHTIAALIAAGAHDAWAIADRDEEGPPGTHRACAVRPVRGPADRRGAASRDRLAGSARHRTATLAATAQRTQVIVDGHTVRAKVALGRVKVEYDDAAAAAAALGRPLRDVLAEATALAERDVQ